jgi:hypothetical protein
MPKKRMGFLLVFSYLPLKDILTSLACLSKEIRAFIKAEGNNTPLNNLRHITLAIPY